MTRVSLHRLTNKDERVDFFVRVEKWRGEITNLEPNKCDDLSWFDSANTPKNLIPYVAEAIANVNKGRLFSEFGW